MNIEKRLEKLAERGNYELDEVRDAFDDVRAAFSESDEAAGLSDQAIDRFSLNILSSTIVNAEDESVVFKEAIFTGVGDVSDYNTYIIEKTQEEWENAKPPERKKMIREGRVMTMTKVVDGRPHQVAVTRINKSSKNDDGIFIVDDGEEWNPNSPEPIIPRQTDEKSFAFSEPIKPNPVISVYGIVNSPSENGDANYVRFQARVYGNNRGYCDPNDPKFMGNVPMFVPVNLRVIVSDNQDDDPGFIQFSRIVDYEKWTDETLEKINFDPVKYIFDIKRNSDHVYIMYLDELPEFFEKRQARLDNNGAIIVKRNKKGAVINYSVFGFSVVKVHDIYESRVSFRGDQVRVKDGSISGTIAGNVPTYINPTADWELSPERDVIICFQANRTNRKWTRETGAQEVPVVEGDFNLEILGATPATRIIEKDYSKFVPNLKKKDVE